MSKQEISINELKIGMFIVGLDISWIDSPFLLNSKKITSETDITKLRKSGAKRITVDLDRCDVLPPPPTPPTAKSEQTIPAHKEEKPALALEKNDTKIATVQEKSPKSTNKPFRAEQEINEAADIHNQLSGLATSIINDMAQGVTVDIKPLNELISKTLASLSRNNQALFSLLHMQRKTGEIYQHAVSVFGLSMALSNSLNLTEQQQKDLGCAALIHDAGWLKLPLQLFGKGKAYSEAERQLIAKHPLLSLKMLDNVEDISDQVKILVAGHQERADGSGYPTQKSIKNNPCWNILTVADRYDELVHQLLDQPGMVPKNALLILYKEAQKGLLDTTVVERLISLLGVYPISSAVELSSGEKAVVIECLRDKPSHPVVRVYYDKRGMPLSKPYNIDLSQQQQENLKEIKMVIDPRKPGVDPAHILVINPLE